MAIGFRYAMTGGRYLMACLAGEKIASELKAREASPEISIRNPSVSTLFLLYRDNPYEMWPTMGSACVYTVLKLRNMDNHPEGESTLQEAQNGIVNGGIMAGVESTVWNTHTFIQHHRQTTLADTFRTLLQPETIHVYRNYMWARCSPPVAMGMLVGGASAAFASQLRGR